MPHRKPPLGEPRPARATQTGMTMSIEEAVHLADMDNLTRYRYCWKENRRRLAEIVPTLEGDHVSDGGGRLARLHSQSPPTIYRDELRGNSLRGALLVATLLTDLQFRGKPETGYRDVFQPKDSHSIRKLYGDAEYAYLACILHPRQIAGHIWETETVTAAIELWDNHPERPEAVNARLAAASEWNGMPAQDRRLMANPFLDKTGKAA